MYVLRTMAYGIRMPVYVLRTMAYGIRMPVYVLRSMAYGIRIGRPARLGRREWRERGKGLFRDPAPRAWIRMNEWNVLLILAGTACVMVNVLLLGIHLYLLCHGTRAADPAAPETRPLEPAEEAPDGGALRVVVSAHMRE